MRHPRTATRGYTLIELVFYLALFVGITVFAIRILLGLVNAWAQARVSRALIRSGTDALERIVREGRFAKGIRVAESVFNIHPGVLSLDTYTEPSSETLTTIKFSVVSGQLMVEEGSSGAVALTAGNISVDSFKVWEVAPMVTASTTRVELTLSGGTGTAYAKTATFSATMTLRGSYQR